jgi:HEAT repeat protein
MVFGLFSKERTLRRAMDKASNKYAQSIDRMAALEKLAQSGTEEALLALAKRFAFTYDKGIEDEQEKQWVYERLCAEGEAALGPLHTYMKSASSVAYPLRVLEKVASPDKALAIIDDLLASEEPGYTRDPTRRIQIIDWLADYTDASDADIARRVVPYLADFDEHVRFSAAEALNLHPDESALEPLVDVLLNEEEQSKRLKLRVAEILADQRMELGERRHEVAALCDDLLTGYKLHQERLVKKS